MAKILRLYSASIANSEKTLSLKIHHRNYDCEVIIVLYLRSTWEKTKFKRNTTPTMI